MRMKKFATLTIALTLLLTIGVFGQVSSSSQATASSSSKSKATTHQSTGTISSMDNDKIVLTHKVNGKEEETTYMIDDQTKKEGELKPGDKATVHYRIENGKDIATVVKGSSSMAKGSKRK